MDVLSKLWKFLNRDLTGRTWENEKLDPNLGKMTYFGGEPEGGSYWEVSLSLGEEQHVDVFFQGSQHGPTEFERRFLLQLKVNANMLEELCRKMTEANAEFNKIKASDISGLELSRNGAVRRIMLIESHSLAGRDINVGELWLGSFRSGVDS